MSKFNDKYIDACEKLDWSVTEYEDGSIELQRYSPAGEDFVVSLNGDGSFPEQLRECAADFDIDEHIEMWIEARRNGVKGVPSTRELVKDAEDIDKMLQELAAAVAEVEV